MKRVLVIEDNAMVANVYRATLAREGYRVEVAADGQQGLSAVEREAPDLVMLDLMLPKVPGLEVLRAIRAQLPDVPVIVTSNSFTNERMDSVWAAGATQVLTKASSSPKEIARIVREALERPAEKQGPERA